MTVYNDYRPLFYSLSESVFGADGHNENLPSAALDPMAKKQGLINLKL